MSDEQVILSHYLFIYLQEKKNVDEKKANILRCLEQGADVNAKDGSQPNNTPLHIAVTKDEKDIVQILLDRGAVSNVRNQDNKTPLDIARELQTESGKHIFRLLNGSDKKSTVFNKHFEEKAIPFQTVEKPTNISIQTYSKRPGTAGIKGLLYEIKLLSLFLLRALNDNDIEDLKLGSNIDGAGRLGDICLKLKVKAHDKPITIFLKARHLDPEKDRRLPVDWLHTDHSGCSSFMKYFEDYIKIKKMFKPNNSDDMFDGEFGDIDTNLILYTPLQKHFTRKLVRRTKPSSATLVHNLINTAMIGGVFQFNYEERDIECLVKGRVRERIRSLGETIFHTIIMPIWEKNKMKDIYSIDEIALYHYALRQEVFDVTDIHEIQADKEIKHTRQGTFRPEFFTSSSEYLLLLREIIYKKISSINYPTKEHNTIDQFEDIIKNPNAVNISKVIGKQAFYKNQRLEIVRTAQLYKNKSWDKISNGLAKLVFQRATIEEAVWIKLRGITFTLPAQFGNFDMSFRGTENEIKKRITYLVEKLISLFTKYNESKVVEINDNTVGDKKLIQRRLIEHNGGIGSAVGNLLVLDEDTNMFRFDVDKELPKHAKAILSQLLLYIDKKELRKYRMKINIAGFPKFHFNDNQYEEVQAKDFLNKLWFYTNQAQEHEVETILKREISKYYNNETGNKKSLFKIHTDAIYSESFDKIQKWWMMPERAPYLNKESNFFTRAKEAVIDCPLLTVLNYMFIQKLQKLDITFDQAAVDSLGLHQMRNGLNIQTQAGILTALKINQHFNDDNSFTFIEFENVLNLSKHDYKLLIKDLRCTNAAHLVIIYENPKYNKGNINMKLTQVMEVFIGKNIILVSNNNLVDENGTLEGVNYVSVSDTNNYLIDLTEESQKLIIENSELVFQDDEICIKPTLRWTDND